MKWVIAPLVVATGLLGRDAFAEARKIPSYGNATVIAAPDGEVRAERTADGGAARLLFRTWDADADRTIGLSILNAPLRYRAFPGRQARMAVEVFSDSYDVGFFSHREKAFTQILVGEVFPDESVTALLTAKDLSTRLTGEAADLLRRRLYDDARRAIAEEPAEEEGAKLLRDARLGLVDLVRVGPREAACPIPATQKLDGVVSQEAAFLAAMCLEGKRDPESAIGVLERLIDAGPPPALALRAGDAKRRLVLGRLLDADRRDRPVLVAARFLADRDAVAGRDLDVTIVETLVDNFNRLGLANLMTALVDRLALGADSKRGTAAGGAIAETYLGAEQLLRASDAASYFLAGKPADWLAGRLHRVRGRAALQDGFWADAAADLAAARPLLYDFGPEDLLASAEARLRRGPIAAPVAKKGKRGAAKAPPAEEPVSSSLPKAEDLPGRCAGWFRRIAGQAALDEGRMPDAALLDEQPAYVLYRAAEAFAARGDAEGAKALLERAAAGRGGWAVLAGIDGDILALHKRLEAYRIIAEAKR